MAGNILINPLHFMQNNLVVPFHDSLGTTQGQAGVVTMCLIRSAQDARQHGQPIEKYILYRHRGQANATVAFQAFWCPYAQNDTLTCTLDSSASLMFTATMDGCTFGHGAQDGHGGCSVGHANSGAFGAAREATYGMDGARQFQRGEQENRLTHALGDGLNFISPTDYMADYDGALVLKSTTFGIRNAGAWTFYTQKYLVQGGTYFLRGVTSHN